MQSLSCLQDISVGQRHIHEAFLLTPPHTLPVSQTGFYEKLLTCRPGGLLYLFPLHSFICNKTFLTWGALPSSLKNPQIQILRLYYGKNLLSKSIYEHTNNS